MPAKKQQRIKRTTATRVLAELIERAKEVNADLTHTYGVERLDVFGSYLKEDGEYVGDLDILFRVVQKCPSQAPNRKQFLKDMEEEQLTCEAGGIAMYFYPYERVLKKLKNGSHTISLHPIDEDNPDGPRKNVFSAVLDWPV